MIRTVPTIAELARRRTRSLRTEVSLHLVPQVVRELRTVLFQDLTLSEGEVIVALAVLESFLLFLLNIVQHLLLVIIVHEVLLQAILTESLVVFTASDFLRHVVKVHLICLDVVLSVLDLIRLMIPDHLQVVPQDVVVVLSLPEDHLFREASVFQDVFVVCLVHGPNANKLRSFALRVGIGGTCLSHAFSGAGEAGHGGRNDRVARGSSVADGLVIAHSGAGIVHVIHRVQRSVTRMERSQLLTLMELKLPLVDNNISYLEIKPNTIPLLRQLRHFRHNLPHHHLTTSRVSHARPSHRPPRNLKRRRILKPLVDLSAVRFGVEADSVS